MKMIRKIAMLLLAVCLAVPAVSMVSRAADGSIQFTDPSAVVGETVEVTCAVKTDGSTIGDVDMEISYDTTMLQYESVRYENGSGTLTESAAGTLKYDGSGNGSEDVVRFHMTFYVLKEGSTTIEVENYKAYLASDASLNCNEGWSTVSISAGEAGSEVPPKTTGATVSATDATVEVDGVSYTLSSNVPANEIPEGFAESKIEIDGEEQTVVTNESLSMSLGYLVDAEGKGAFFIYNEEDATFSPFTKVSISSTTYIIWLSDVMGVSMPKEYQLIELTVNGFAYPVWKKADNENNYILYAINNQGATGLYQYDIQEGTYQRFSVVEEAPVEKTEEISGLEGFVKNNFTRALFIVIVVFAFMLLLILVFGVKLYNRNRELDELYDEYEIDLDDDMPSKAPKARSIEKEDEGLSIEDFTYDEEPDEEFEFNFESKEEEVIPPKKTMSEESTFEDFDLDFIDLDD